MHGAKGFNLSCRCAVLWIEHHKFTMVLPPVLVWFLVVIDRLTSVGPRHFSCDGFDRHLDDADRVDPVSLSLNRNFYTTQEKSEMICQ